MKIFDLGILILAIKKKCKIHHMKRLLFLTYPHYIKRSHITHDLKECRYDMKECKTLLDGKQSKPYEKYTKTKTCPIILKIRNAIYSINFYFV